MLKYPDFEVIKNLPSGKLIIPQGFFKSELITSTLYAVLVFKPSTRVCYAKVG